MRDGEEEQEQGIDEGRGRERASGPESIDFGTRRFPTKPTAYRNAARKAR